MIVSREYSANDFRIFCLRKAELQKNTCLLRIQESGGDYSGL